MSKEPRWPDDGDLIGDVCDDCGARYERVMGGDGDRNYCPDCVEEKRELDSLTQVTSCRVRSDEEREKVVELLSQEYLVDVDERLGKVMCYTQGDE